MNEAKLRLALTHPGFREISFTAGVTKPWCVVLRVRGDTASWYTGEDLDEALTRAAADIELSGG